MSKILLGNTPKNELTQQFLAFSMLIFADTLADNPVNPIIFENSMIMLHIQPRLMSQYTTCIFLRQIQNGKNLCYFWVKSAIVADWVIQI